MVLKDYAIRKKNKVNEELRLSVSKSKCFNQCKKQFQFNYLLKFPKKERDYHISGKFCHSTLEWFHNQYIAGSSLPYNTTMADAFKFAWSEYKEKMTPEMKKECWEIINNYLRSITGKKMTALSMEKRFELNIGENVILNGAIDFIKIDDDNVLHVSDYKTTKNKKYLVGDWFQLLTYCYVLYMEDPTITKIRASYILLRHNSEYITKEFVLDDFLVMKEKYIKYAELIRNEKEYAPTTSQLCNYCDYQEHCPKGLSMSREKTVYGEVAW